MLGINPTSSAVALALAAALAVVACDDDDDDGMMMPTTPTTFTVTVTNVSQPMTIDTDRAMGTVPLSPGVFVAFAGEDPAFQVGQMADSGTELIAEDGFPSQMLSPAGTTGTELEILQAAENVAQAGTFSSGGGADDGPAIFPALGGSPAESATFTFQAEPGDRLQIETMFVQSNDWFYGFSGGGLQLFMGETPVSGDVTAQLVVYDAGTEADTPPGTGPDQKPAQDPTAIDVGPAESELVQAAAQRHPGFDIPAATEVIRVVITPQ